MMWQFFAGCAVGSIITLVAMLLALSSSKADARIKEIEAEDALRVEARKKREQLDAETREAHEDIDRLTPAEMDMVLAGTITLAELRKRKSAGEPPPVPTVKPDGS